MPPAETTGTAGVRRSTKLLQGLFWAGVALSPLAALLLLIGSGFGLQVAAVLAVLVVVLIGLSIALRQSGDAVRGEVEELVYEEIDSLRDDVRGDITHAARQTHGQLMERIGVLHETVDALRGQVEHLRGQLERAAAQPPPAAHPTASAAVSPGMLRRTETVQVTTKTTVVDPSEAHGGTVYGGRAEPPRREPPRPDIPQQRRPDPAERVSSRAEFRPRPEPRSRPEEPSEPRVYGRRAEREEQSWTEQLLRERAARGDSDEWPQTPPREDVERRGGGGRRRAHDPDEDPVTGMRTTDRWAEVHSDERGGRELRMGERRTSRHADETGTHVRIEDRWASVRHEEYYPEEPRTGGHRAIERSPEEAPRRSAARRDRERDWAEREETTGGHRRPDTEWSPRRPDEGRRDEEAAGRWSSRERSAERPALGSARAALPASPAEPASRWTQGPSSRDEERVGRRPDERASRRSRAVDDDDDYGWNGGREEHRGGPRSARPIVDFGGDDDRWR